MIVITLGTIGTNELCLVVCACVWVRYNETGMWSECLRGVSPTSRVSFRHVGVVRSGQVVWTGQWRHDAGSHSTDHSRRVRLWAVQ